MNHSCLAVCLFAALVAGCVTEEQKSTDDIEKLGIEGVRNVYRLSPRIITGGQPDTEAGFVELQKLGVKTIVSVTDAEPDEEAAGRHGMKYVHVPMNYEGVSPGQREKILSAAAEASGPVYIHCDSGRNRAATAAAICLIGIEGKSSEDAIRWMKMRGVDEDKNKLYEAVGDCKPEPAR